MDDSKPRYTKSDPGLPGGTAGSVRAGFTPDLEANCAVDI